MNKSELDLSLCDQEPVSFIGRVQSFGTLLAVEQSSQRITHFAKNVGEFLSLPENKILGMRIEDVFPGASDFFDQNPMKHFNHGDLIIGLKRSGKKEIYEIEKRSQDRSDFEALVSQLDQLQGANDLQDLLEKTAEVIFKLTGLDRVMIYHFHEDLHGEVLAEKTKKGVDSFLGLHYPASDIPAPARAQFLSTWLRMIADVHGPTFEVVSEEKTPLDLTPVLCRATSPIHIEYLKNMAVGASLTVPLKVNGKLWGLIACHNIRPKNVPMSIRENCELIGRMASTHIGEVERMTELKMRNQVDEIHRHLVEHIRGSEDMSAELTKRTPNLLDLVSSGGASAALYLDGHWASVGKVPSDQELNGIVSWLQNEHKGEAHFSTHEFSKHYPEARNFSALASGVLAIWIPKGDRNYILWFRPEVTQTVRWAGNPNEKVLEASGRLSPRGSFELWKESVKNQSVKWKSWEVDAAMELRNSIMALDLRLQFEKEQRARAEAELAVAAREELVAMVSHDLKNPLSSIQMNASLMERFLSNGDEKLKGIVQRIHRSSVVMNNLIEDILSVTKLESGNVELELKKDDFQLLISEAIAILGPIANQKRITLEHNKDIEICPFSFDYGRMLQVLSNLIGNAIKFTPEEGKITVAVEKCGPEFVTFSVQDSGTGIPKENLAHIFDRFWQAKQTKKMGTGLGLAIVKGIVASHGGEIWVTSELGVGSKFHVSIPMRL